MVLGVPDPVLAQVVLVAGRPVDPCPRRLDAGEEWIDNADPVGARIVPERMFTFHLADERLRGGPTIYRTELMTWWIGNPYRRRP